MGKPHKFREIKPEQVVMKEYDCQRCRKTNRVAVLPYSPRISKHDCRFCDNRNTVITRQSMMDKIDEHVAEGKDRNRTVGPIKHKVSFDMKKGTGTPKEAKEANGPTAHQEAKKQMDEIRRRHAEEDGGWEKTPGGILMPGGT